MTTVFQIDEEIDKLIDKFSEELKIRLKKAIMRSEKIVLKQYIASQRETAKAKKSSGKMIEVNVTSSPKNSSRGSKPSSKNEKSAKTPRKMGGSPTRQKMKQLPKREQDYSYLSDDSS